jgi:hypothetical protein
MGVFGVVFIYPPIVTKGEGGDGWAKEDDRDVYKLVIVREDWDC